MAHTHPCLFGLYVLWFALWHSPTAGILCCVYACALHCLVSSLLPVLPPYLTSSPYYTITFSLLPCPSTTFFSPLPFLPLTCAFTLCIFEHCHAFCALLLFVCVCFVPPAISSLLCLYAALPSLPPCCCCLLPSCLLFCLLPAWAV